MSKKVVAVILLGVLLGAFMGIPAAQANPFAGVITCSVTLPSFPNPAGGAATCDGTASGVSPKAVCAPTCAFTARVNAYSEPCLVPVGFPILGTANGRMIVDGTDIGSFNWVRVGLTAVLVPPDTAGVAAFAPTSSPIPSCGAAPGPITATVVGLGLVL